MERFQLLGTLGEGGMGKVLSYEDRALERRVAIKILRDKDERGGADALIREARVLGALAHPSIIPVYDVGEDPDYGTYYVMPLLEQPTLEDALTALREGRTTHGRLMRMFIQVCQAVAYAHSRGVVHCDLKPANVLLGSFGEVFVADWGFAHRDADGHKPRGGTPGFMAPEQLMRGGKVDGRADVFALGVIFYQLLTDKLPYPFVTFEEWDSAAKKGERAMKPATPPSARAKDRTVPAELDELCMRAIELDKDRRLGTAKELANGLEAFIEGTKEKKRRAKRAADLTEQGTSLTTSYEDLLQAQRERHDEIARLRARLPPWAPHAAKEELWQAEDASHVLSSLAARTFQAAVSALETALDESADHPGARAALSGLYAAEHARAILRRDELPRRHYEALALDYDDGRFARLLEAGGSLHVGSDDEAAEIVVRAVEEDGARLAAAREVHGHRGRRAPIPLPAGTYLVTARGETGREATAPVLLLPGGTVDLRLALAETEDAWVHVPAGRALLGGHPTSLYGAALREVDVAAFTIARLPVTMAEYLAFVAERASAEPSSVTALLPCDEAGAPLWRWEGGPVPAAIQRWGDDLARLRALPAFGVDVGAARAYAAWLSKRLGRAVRLPTDDEWEKAARGVDGRAYPWGDRFDGSLCKSRVSHARAAAPEPAGAYSDDASPYGVRDMAGGVAEWVESGEGALPALRGGSWMDWPEACHAGARRAASSDERTTFAGFRLVREVGEALRTA